MTKNKRGGKKHKRGKKLTDDASVRKNVELAEAGQEYAKVLSRLGGARLQVECTDGKQRQAIIPGKFRKKIWMNPGDVILVSVDATGNDDVCAVDKKYNQKDIMTLKQKGLINFEDDELESKMHYEFKSTEGNLGKVHPNVSEQPEFPSFDSDDSDEYMKPSKQNNTTDESDSTDSSDKKTYTLDDL